MSRDTSVIRLRQPDVIDDPLSELAREGARRMLAQALTAEADAFVAMGSAHSARRRQRRGAPKPGGSTRRYFGDCARFGARRRLEL